MALIQMDYMADTIQRWTTSWVYLPFDETTSSEKPSALVLLHGYGDNHTDWLMKTNLCRAAAKHNMALIMPDGDNSYYLNYTDRAENYEAYIAKELPQLMQKAFSIMEEPENTYIMGVSMGGMGALRIGAKYGDVYSKAAGLSSATRFLKKTGSIRHDADVKKTFETALDDGKKIAALYLAVGLNDPMLAENRSLHRLLEGRQVPHIFREVPEQGHTWEFWDEESFRVLSWMKEG